MPIDYNNNIITDFPFESYIEKISTLFSSPIIQEYLMRWKKVFLHLDMLNISELQAFCAKNAGVETYIYEQTHPTLSTTYQYAFIIDNILERYKKTHARLYKISNIIKIANYDDSILLSKQELKKSPILLVPFHAKPYTYIVIDGNKRLTYAVSKRKKYIRVICVDRIFREDFVLSIDYAMYIFQLEINWLLKEKDSNLVESALKNEGILNSHPFFKELCL